MGEEFVGIFVNFEFVLNKNFKRKIYVEGLYTSEFYFTLNLESLAGQPPTDLAT